MNTITASCKGNIAARVAARAFQVLAWRLLHYLPVRSDAGSEVPLCV
jgi:hypothetical protein